MVICIAVPYVRELAIHLHFNRTILNLNMNDELQTCDTPQALKQRGFLGQP